MRHLLCTCCLMLLHAVLAAQPGTGRARIDSLLSTVPEIKDDTAGVVIMDAIAAAYRRIAPDSGIAWARKELALAQRLGWRRGEAMAFNALGANVQNKSNHTGAMEAYFKALTIYDSLHDTHGLAEVQGNIGNVYYRQQNFAKGLEYLNRSLQLAGRTGDKLLASSALGYMATIYRSQGRLDTAMRYAGQALALALASGDKGAVFQQYSNIGTIYMVANKPNLALVNYFRAYRLAQETGDRQGHAIMLGNIGGAYYSAASDSAGPHADSLVRPTPAANYALCIAYLRRATDACREAQVYDYISAINETLSDALAATGDYKGALEAHKVHDVVQDSLHNNAITEKLSSLEARRTLELKNKDLELARLAVAKKRNERGLFGVIITLLVALFAAAYAYLLQRTRERQRRREEAIRQRIARDLHDDIGSTLSAINIYSNVAGRQAGGTQPLLNKISETSGKVMEAMSDIVWSINHSEDDFESFVNRMREHAVNLFDNGDTALHFSVDESAQQSAGVPPEYRKDYYLIYKEALNNAAKYAAAGNVWVDLDRVDGQLLLRIRDDGAGFDPEAPHREGNGLKNMRTRAAAIGAALQLQSRPTGGTVVELRI